MYARERDRRAIERGREGFCKLTRETERGGGGVFPDLPVCDVAVTHAEQEDVAAAEGHEQHAARQVLAAKGLPCGDLHGRQ